MMMLNFNGHPNYNSRILNTQEQKLSKLDR